MIKIGTICSGIGTQEMVGDIFNELWNRMNPDSPLKAYAALFDHWLAQEIPRVCLIIAASIF